MNQRSKRTGIVAITAVVATTGLLLPGASVGAVEVGTDDFRVSSMGPDLAVGYEALQSKIAFDPVDEQYLVVWRGDQQGDGQAEIYGQLIDARTGAEIGGDFLVARVGAAGDPDTDAIEPAVVWSGTNGEFVVVYTGDEDSTDSSPIVSDTFEIYARRVSSGGVPQGVPLRVSDMGTADADDSYDANFADVAWNSQTNQFLVVWQGDDDAAPLVNNETEIHGQRLGYSGANLVELGSNDFRISAVGVDGATATDGRAPAVAYNTHDNQYYVVWQGNYVAATPGVFEVHGTRVSAIGAVDDQVGTALNTITASDEELQPDVVGNPVTGQFAVVWSGDEGDDNFEIHRQLVDADGTLAGTSLAISNAGGSSTAYVANTPAIAFDTLQDQYIVVWSGDDSTLGTADDEYEVFLRRFDDAGNTVGGAARISTMGVNGQVNTSTASPDVTFSDDAIGAVGTVWNAENQPITTAGESEIWGQFDAPASDLSVTVTVQSDTTPAPGDPVSYRIDWANNGPRIVPDAVLSASVDALFQNAVGSPPADTPGNPMSWELGTLSPGDNGFVVVTGNVLASAVQGDSVDFDAEIATDSLVADSDVTDNSDNGSVVVDLPPSVTIDQAGGQGDPTNGSPILFSVVFSEPVTGFTAGDVSLTGSTVGGTLVAGVSGSGANYTVSVTGMSGVGTVVASIPAGAATDIDGAPDTSTASTSTDDTVSFDNVAPTVTINQAGGQADPTNGSPVQFSVVFSEAVSGFTGSDVSFTGSTIGGTLVASVTGTGLTYTVSVTGMSGTGTVVASIPASSANDLAGNATGASSSTDNSVTFDNVAPTVTIDQASGQGDPTNGSPIDFTVVFSEAVTGFTAADVSFAGSTVGGTLVAAVSGSGPTYTVSVTGMNGLGAVVASIPASSANDLAGNPSSASTSTDNSVTFDNVAPSVTIDQASGQGDPTNGSPIDFTVVFSEAVTGFTAADVSFAGSTVGGTLVAAVSGSGPTYTVSVTGMNGAGTVVASIAAAAATDTVGNASTASSSTDNSVTFDNVAPSVTVDKASGQGDPTNGSPIDFTVVFSEAVTGFTAADVSFAGSTVGGTLVAAVSGSGPTYTVSVTGMNGVGAVVVSLPASSANDLAGNATGASSSTDNSVTFDNVAPSVTVDKASGQGDPTNGSPIDFTVVFSEAVTGFAAADVSFAGSTVGGTLAAAVSGAGPTYTVSVTGMSGVGTVVASIPATTVTDLAGNANGASTSTDNTVAFDNAAPTVTVEQGGQPDPTNVQPVNFVVVFSEPVLGFSAADVVLGGTASGTLTAVVSGPGPTYTISVSGMTGFGTITASVAAGAATDATGNLSTASTSTDNTVAYVPGDPNPGVNDPPVLTAPATASAELGVPVLFTGGNTMSVVDPDAFGTDVRVTVSVTDGTVIVPTGGGATITGAGTASATITGSMSAVNSALSGVGVIFTETGSRSIVLTADDLGHSPPPAQTDTATITATVVDTTAPVLIVPSVTVTATTDAGQPGAIVTYVVTVTDLGSQPPSAGLVQAAAPTFTCTPPSGSFFPIGTTTVTCTATDAAGNTSSASFAVQVVDDEDPTITPPADVRVTLPPGASSGVVTYTVPSASDNSGSVTITCAPPSGSTVPAGSTTVTCTATDPSGNTATATFLVDAVSGVLPPTGGGAGLVPLATAALFAGFALLVMTRRRRAAAR